MPASRPQVVYIVDDDAGVRDSLTLLLGLRGFAPMAFASGEAFLQHVRAAPREGVVLLDLRMAGMTGADVQRELGALGAALPVIMVTAHGDAASARHALKSGAFDFIEKPIDDAMLLQTIEAAIAVDRDARAIAMRRDDIGRRVGRLTQREREVLSLVVNGRHNREIAAELGISARTVEVYKARLMDKLSVERLPDLIRLAIDAQID